MHDILPSELWIKIAEHTQSIDLLLTNKAFFELISMINTKLDIIEYITQNKLYDVLKYLVLLKKMEHSIFSKNIINIELLNKNLVKNCEKGQLDIIKYLVLLGADIRTENDLVFKIAC